MSGEAEGKGLNSSTSSASETDTLQEEIVELKRKIDKLEDQIREYEVKRDAEGVTDELWSRLDGVIQRKEQEKREKERRRDTLLDELLVLQHPERRGSSPPSMSAVKLEADLAPLIDQLAMLDDLVLGNTGDTEEGQEGKEFKGPLVDLECLAGMFYKTDKLFGEGKAYCRDVFRFLWVLLRGFEFAPKGNSPDQLLLHGAPGTGKSLLGFLFCCFVCRHTDWRHGDIHYFRKVRNDVIVYYRMCTSGVLQYYGAIEEMSKRTIRELMGYANDTEHLGMFTVVDGMKPDDISYVVHWNFQISSYTETGDLRHEVETNVVQYIMSPWSLESILESFDAGLTFVGCESEEELQFRYNYVGGCMRNLVQSTPDCVDWANKVVADIKSTGDASRFLSSKGPDRIARRFAQLPDCKISVVAIDSAFILHAVVASTNLQQFKNLLIMGRHYGGSLYGIALELFVHKYVQQTNSLALKVKGESETIRWTLTEIHFKYITKCRCQGKGSIKCANETAHVLKELTELKSTPVYWTVELCNLATVDSGILLADGTVILLQITVSGTHSFNHERATALANATRESIGCNGARSTFVFLVSPEEFDSFCLPKSCNRFEDFDFLVATPSFEGEEFGLGGANDVIPEGVQVLYPRATKKRKRSVTVSQ